ncbi:hypothetical protein B0H13DRAFT_1895464 [Mycena leptocephala]|nr:hypothetical protein B0H13DRAFT_1895464 [Mycena leptocephala]
MCASASPTPTTFLRSITRRHNMLAGSRTHPHDPFVLAARADRAARYLFPLWITRAAAIGYGQEAEQARYLALPTLVSCSTSVFPFTSPRPAPPPPPLLVLLCRPRTFRMLTHISNTMLGNPGRTPQTMRALMRHACVPPSLRLVELSFPRPRPYLVSAPPVYAFLLPAFRPVFLDPGGATIGGACEGALSEEDVGGWVADWSSGANDGGKVETSWNCCARREQCDSSFVRARKNSTG